MHRLQSDLFVFVLEVVVGVGGGLGVGQTRHVATQSRRQAVVGIEVEDVFKTVDIADLAVVDVGLRVIAIIAGG